MNLHPEDSPPRSLDKPNLVQSASSPCTETDCSNTSAEPRSKKNWEGHGPAEPPHSPGHDPPNSFLKAPIHSKMTVRPLSPSCATPRRFEARWKLIFDKFVEVKTEMFTHVNISTLTTSCIDRAFISIAPSSTTVMQFLGGSIRTPMEWHAMGLSDHAPTYWSIAQVNRESSLPPKIPPYVCKSGFSSKVCKTI